MTDWTGYIEVPGGKLYAEADGEGPAVVFIHAGVAHLRMWDEQVAALRDAYRAGHSQPRLRGSGAHGQP